jgi:hypothetical protein
LRKGGGKSPSPPVRRLRRAPSGRRQTAVARVSVVREPLLEPESYRSSYAWRASPRALGTAPGQLSWESQIQAAEGCGTPPTRSAVGSQICGPATWSVRGSRLYVFPSLMQLAGRRGTQEVARSVPGCTRYGCGPISAVLPWALPYLRPSRLHLRAARLAGMSCVTEGRMVTNEERRCRRSSRHP